MAFCTNCGTKLDDNVKFCSSCGNLVGSPAQVNPPPQPAPLLRTVTVGQVKKCPSCGSEIESFQTRCSSCGHEISTVKDEELVSNFFIKLDELAQKEYEANKQREGKTKAKRKQPKAVVICEVVSITSLILILLHVTGMRNVLLVVIFGLLGIGE
jgi:uncharacterized membrane protein YvbJ